MADTQSAKATADKQEAKSGAVKNALGDEPQSAVGSGKEPTKADTRDTNGAGGRVAAAKAQAAEEQAGIEVLQYMADGSVKTTTIGELAETHGEVMAGPTVGDLNPAFAPGAAAHNGAASE